ncbi:MAG: hypothetical protein SPL63_11475 [Roseburia faecis]|nr:hypothetical protein [Roseburia faecis]
MKDIKDYTNHLLFKALYLLNGKMEEHDLAPIELNVCGGFAMMANGLRDPDCRTDIDFAGKDLAYEVKALSKEVAKETGIDKDWLNNDMVLSGYSLEDFSLSTGALHFDPMFDMSKIRVNVLEPRDLLKLKMISIDTSMTAIEYGGDFTRMKDFKDVEILLKHEHLTIDEACRKYRNNLISDTTQKILHAYEEGGEDQVIAVVHAVQDKNKITNEYIRDDKSPDRSGLSMIEGMLNEAKQRIAEEDRERDGSSNTEPPRRFSLHDKHGKEYVYDRVKNTLEMENPKGEIVIDSLYEWLRSPMFPRELLPQIKEIREKYPPAFSMKTFAEGLEEELHKERRQRPENTHEENRAERNMQKIDDMEL